MILAQLAFASSPLLGIVAGYFLDGAAGALSGFAILTGPVVMMWIFGESSR